MSGLKRQNLVLSDRKVHDWVAECLKLQILRVGLGAQDLCRRLDRVELVFVLTVCFCVGQHFAVYEGVKSQFEGFDSCPNLLGSSSRQ